MCIGLEETSDDDGKQIPLMDLNEPPFNQMKKKKDIKPSLDVLREEVKRRSAGDSTANNNKPKPNGWSAKKCIEWLQANPIATADDRTFLVKRAQAVKQVISNATQQKSPTSLGNQSLEGEQGNKWYGPIPYL